MIRFDDLPIQRKLILLALTASSAALLLAFFGFLGYEIVNSRVDSIGRLETLASVVGKNSAAALAFGDPEAATETLQALQEEGHVDGACLYSLDRELFASFSQAGDDLCVDRLDTARSLASFENEKIHVVRPIDRDGDDLGFILILGNRNEFYQRINRYALIALLVMAASFTLALALSHRLQRMISTPILDLVRAANAVRKERAYFRRVNKRGEDECGRLVDAFNDMLSEIDRRDREEKLRRNLLEEEVASRTAELRRTNQELESEIKDRRRAEEALRHEAFHDSLTGLGNRALLMSELDKACQAFRLDQNVGFALLFLDLDGFKLVNDSLGHTVGDVLLSQAARRLSGALPAPNLIARLGGDEFAILLRNLALPEQVKSLGEQVLACLSEPFVLQSREIFINGSIGAVVSSLNSCTPEKLLRDADAAMYRAKAVGKATISFFDEGMESSALDRLELRNDLQRALERDEFFLDYQPICSTVNGLATGCEALVRWRHPTRGVLSPSHFISLIEDMGLVHRVGEWVLRRACAQNAEWRDRGYRAVYVSVNVSPLQFQREDFTDLVGSALQETGLQPHWLKLEVTESLLMENSDFTSDRLRALDRLGVRIAVDDFGTGYSSLNYLRRWPIHTLKIDRSFIAESRQDLASAEIVTAIANMARALGLNLTAEGVELPDQLRLVAAAGCQEVQGYLFGKPMSPENFVEACLNPELRTDVEALLGVLSGLA